MSEQNLGSVNENDFNQTILDMQNATQEVREQPRVESEKADEKEESTPIPEKVIVDKELDPVDQEFISKRDSDLENEAKRMGWRPQEEFKGNQEDFISATEYIGRTDLYNKISNQNKVIKRLEEGMTELTGLNKKQHEMLLKEKAEYLLHQKRLAIENGNVDETERFENAYHEINKELIPGELRPGKIQNQPEVHPAALEFARRNANWFNEDNAENSNMKDYAIKKEVYLQKLYPEWSDEKRLVETEKSVKEFFGNKFRNVNRDRAPQVAIPESQNYSPKGKSEKFTFNQLPTKHKAIVRTMCRHGGLSLDEYAQQLHDMGEV